MGDHDTEANNEPLPHIDRKVKSIVFHPKFKTLTFKSIGYDVALLKLYNPVDFAANLIPICLPQNDNQLVDEIAWTKGFGALYEGKDLSIYLTNHFNHQIYRYFLHIVRKCLPKWINGIISEVQL